MEKQEAKIAETANETANGAVADAPVTEAGNAGQGDRGAARGRGGRTERGGRDRNPRRPRRNEGGRERVRPEFDQKIISIRRVTRVMAGGRRFSFSVAMVIGDKKGRVGVGIGKAGDTQLAIEKAVRDAK